MVDGRCGRRRLLFIAAGAPWALSGVMAVPNVFDPAINLSSMLFPAAIGVVFGRLPAGRAARMDPVRGPAS